MKKARILVVEDEELVGLSIRNFLQSIDYEVPAVVSSGEKAVRDARTLEPNLVLMDIHLAGRMGGIEAAGIIKDSCHVPVIYLTAYSDTETLQKAKLTEPFGYVLKPFDERSLEASIEMALHKASRQEEHARTRERMATILQSIGDGIIIANIKGGIDYINGTAAELLHLKTPLPPSTSVVTLLKLVTHRSRQEISLPLDEVIVEGQRVGYRNCIIVTDQGTRCAVDLNLEPYRDERGTVRGILLVFRDIAAPRRIEGLIEDEINAAVDIHKGLLPANGTTLDDVQMHGVLLPAAFGAGDIYNFYRIDDAHAGFFIVDIMGHGMVAASLAYLVSRLLEPSSPGQALPFLGVSPLSPRQTVIRLNELLLGFAGGAFFSMCYGVITLKTGKVTVIRAGHPFPIVQRADGRLEEIRAEGHAVGISPRMDLVEAELSLAHGDRLFLYSDGVTECTNLQSVEFSRDRLMSLIRDSRAGSLSATVGGISTAIAAWRNNESFDDDVTLVGIEMGP
jgi:PAS domain S-box-containing protein